ncbi:endonuclease/exonuclease/phosphatase family protein [Ereboglobus luteus]|uniref:Endonuclease/exonuclease/phosphatase domain-containing protein n=1 Tax=Ereboglobus luteus TaxID=1796921 RepID=A0A2U8E6U2_9BACT|nr:endonuclease/exonuclease/phosphatase family protein [Ereboglobus luteus]AWI10649.1 hypothetical protein CKA38_11150 [Ereboglobus luteus]
MNKIIPALLLFFASHIALADNLYIASFNIRTDAASDYKKFDGWSQRVPVISSLIRFHDFDFVGTQEVKPNQLADMLKLMPEYAHIGVGRDDGTEKGEHCALFYKKDKYTLLEQDTFWLSETPGIAGSKGWDARYARICTWGKFQSKTGAKQTVYIFNLHMDHKGVQAREESAKLVLKMMKSIAGKSPALIMGDFNVTQISAPYAVLAKSNYVTDCFDAAPIKHLPNGTFNGFNVNRRTDERIDHIFVTKQFTVERYAILGECYWIPVPKELMKEGDTEKSLAKKGLPKLPSDHFPVAVKVRLAE